VHHGPQARPAPTPADPHRGESEAALRRAAAFATAGTRSTGNRSLAAPLRRLDELLGEHGRNRAEVTVTVSPYFQELSPTTVEQYAEAGPTRARGCSTPRAWTTLPGAFDALMPSMERAASL